MFLDLKQANVPMKLVYQLSKELEEDPEQIILAKEVTLDKSRPYLGLKGTHGFFGSDEWWESINEGKIPLLFFSGVILRAYVAGQDTFGENNTVDLRLNDGSIHSAGIFINSNKDSRFFHVGHRADIVYALDEMKDQPARNGDVNYAEIPLEMAVSLEPVE